MIDQPDHIFWQNYNIFIFSLQTPHLLHYSLKYRKINAITQK